MRWLGLLLCGLGSLSFVSAAQADEEASDETCESDEGTSETDGSDDDTTGPDEDTEASVPQQDAPVKEPWVEGEIPRRP